MNQRTKMLVQLLVLAGVATGLGLFAYFGVHEADKKEEAVKDVSERLFSPFKVGEKDQDGGAPVAEFVKLVVTAKGDKTVVEREVGADWLITSPVKARADKLIVDTLVSQLQTQKFKRKLDESPDEETLKRYGLTEPQFTVEAEVLVGVAKEKRTVRLFGGEENTFDGSIYMRRDDDKAVYQAEGGVRYSLQKSTLDLRQKDVLAVDVAKVKKVAMKSKFNDWELEKQADQLWALTRPVAEPADQNTIAGMLGGLGSERANVFPPDTADERKRTGVETPSVDATLTLEDGSTIRMRFVRPATDAGTASYALREDGFGTILAEFPPNTAGVLDRNAFDLKDKAILRLKREDVAQLVIHPAEGDELKLEQEQVDAGSGAWKVVAPQAGPAKTFKISAALWSLTALRSQAVADEKPKDLAKFGIGPKSKWISLRGRDGQELGRITFGADVVTRPGSAYVQGTKGAVYEVDATPFKDLPFALADVLDITPAAAPADAGAPAP